MSNHPLYTELKKKFNKSLPGETAHIEMAPLNRPISSEALKNVKNCRESAVSIILYPHENKLNSLLIQRPVYEGTHSGQIAFPGGKTEETDSSNEHTARRESWEEIGLPINYGLLIQELTQVYIPISNFLVFPFVFFVDVLPELTPNEREVNEIIHYPIEILLNEKCKSTMEIKFPNGIIQKKIPCFEINDKQIWGATALILNELREILKD